MKNSILNAALNVSVENLEATAGSEALLESHIAEANDLTPEVYVDERLEMEQDVEVLEEAAAQIEANEQVSHEQLDNIAQLANAVMGRYGVSFEGTGIESLEEPRVRASILASHIRDVNASLESSMDISMESYSIADLWDKVGLLNREVPALRDNIAILKNYVKESARLQITPAFGTSLVYAFRVDGSIPDNIPKAATDTGAIIGDLIKLGTDLIDSSKKAADMAIRVDWKDADAAAKAMKSINSIKTPVDDVYRRFDDQFVMGNRRLNVKKFEIKGTDNLSNWATGGSLNVSWQKATVWDMVFHPGYVQLAQGARKRTIKIDELVASLDKFYDAASKTQQMRSSSPKKWQAHKQLKSRLKKDVTGTSESKVVRRVILETDRLGWQCLNGAVTILYAIIREINIAAERVAKDARKRSK